MRVCLCMNCLFANYPPQRVIPLGINDNSDAHNAFRSHVRAPVRLTDTSESGGKRRDRRLNVSKCQSTPGFARAGFPARALGVKA